MPHQPFGSRKNNGGRATGRHADKKRSAKESRVLKGLCVNCAKRDTCLLPEPEGGVWHCEQYVEDR